MSLPSPRSTQDSRLRRLRAGSRELWLEATLGHPQTTVGRPSSSSSSSSSSASSFSGREMLQQRVEEENGSEEEIDDVPEEYTRCGSASEIAATAAAAAKEAAARATAAEAAAEEAAAAANRAAIAAHIAARAAESEAETEEEEERMFLREIHSRRMMSSDGPPRLPLTMGGASPSADFQLRKWSTTRWSDGIKNGQQQSK